MVSKDPVPAKNPCTGGRKPRDTLAVLRKEGTARVVYLVAPRRRAVLARVEVPARAKPKAHVEGAGWVVTLFAVTRRTPRWWEDLVPEGVTLRVGRVLEWPTTWAETAALTQALEAARVAQGAAEEARQKAEKALVDLYVAPTPRKLPRRPRKALAGARAA